MLKPLRLLKLQLLLVILKHSEGMIELHNQWLTMMKNQKHTLIHDSFQPKKMTCQNNNKKKGTNLMSFLRHTFFDSSTMLQTAKPSETCIALNNRMASRVGIVEAAKPHPKHSSSRNLVCKRVAICNLVAGSNLKDFGIFENRNENSQNKGYHEKCR